MPHKEHEDVENVHKLVTNHFDSDKGDFQPYWEVLAGKFADKLQWEKEKSQENINWNYKVPDNIVDDWTGTRFVNQHYGDRGNVQLGDSSFL